MKAHLDVILVGLIVLAAGVYIFWLFVRRWWRKRKGEPSDITPTCGCAECPTDQTKLP